MFKQIVNGGEIEVHLASVLWSELVHLQIDDNEASKFKVIKE